MSAMKKTVVEFVLIGVLGLAAGFSVNAVRAKGSVQPTKNYFDRGTATRAEGTQQVAVRTDLTAAPSENSEPAGLEAATPTPAATAPTQPAPRPVEPRKAAKQHDYQEIGFNDVVAVFEDPMTESGLNVFVDARNDNLFAQGHIPGAVQCDPYQVHLYIDDVLARTNGVDKVIVYCGGGECEDSIFMCRELIEAGVPEDAIYLFAGGWEEWLANDMPVSQGSR